MTQVGNSHGNQSALSAAELEVIRHALAESTVVNGLRRTAAELDMSPSGLRNLIDGAVPYGKTIRRARAWYAQWSHRHGSLDVADRVAIMVLVATVPEEKRLGAANELESVIASWRRDE
jgi:hypothetical protein